MKCIYALYNMHAVIIVILLKKINFNNKILFYISLPRPGIGTYVY